MAIGTPLLNLAGNMVKGIPLDLPSTTMDYWNGHCEELHERLGAFLRQIPVAPSIFGPTSQIILPKRPEPFVPNQVIRVGNQEVEISYVDEEIRAIGTAIPPRGSAAIEYRPLVVNASFKEMDAVLDGKPIELDMVHGLCLLQPKGPNGPEGILLSNGWGNLFPRVLIGAKDRAVYVSWRDGGWYFSVPSVSNTHQWREGRLVFSLNS